MNYPPGPPPGEPPGKPPAPLAPPPDDFEEEEEVEDRRRRAGELQRKHLSKADPTQRLNKLQELYEANLISDAEFEAKRAEILADI